MAKQSTELATRSTINPAFEIAASALIAGKRSKHTQRAYRRDLRAWLTFCREQGINPEQPPIDEVVAFRDKLESELAKESARRTIAAMSSIYSKLLRGGAARSNPFHPSLIAWPPQNTLPKTRLVSDKHARAMIENAASHKVARIAARDAAILQLLYDTGLRRSSVAAIRRDTFVDGCIHAIVKGEKEVELALTDGCIERIEAWLKLSTNKEVYLFPSSTGYIHPSFINRIVRKHANAVGAEHVHPHSFRAAFVTAGYDAGLPEHEIQASVHHADPKTTRRYDRGTRGRSVGTKVDKFRKGRE